MQSSYFFIIKSSFTSNLTFTWGFVIGRSSVQACWCFPNLWGKKVLVRENYLSSIRFDFVSFGTIKWFRFENLLQWVHSTSTAWFHLWIASLIIVYHHILEQVIFHFPHTVISSLFRFHCFQQNIYDSKHLDNKSRLIPVVLPELLPSEFSSQSSIQSYSIKTNMSLI